jgi:hypothetical protein
VGSISTAGEFGAGVTTGCLLKARFGSLVGSDVLAANDIGTITAGAVSDSRVFAGVQPAVTTLPAAATDFANPAGFIRSVSVRGPFSNSLVAAPTVGRASQGVVSVNNGGAAFGVAADRLQALSATTPSGHRRLARLDDPASSIVEGDFNVRLV